MSHQRDQEAALLGALFSARGHRLSGAKLAKTCSGSKIPPHHLEQTLAPYIEAGYPIQFHPQGGLVMQEPPDIWCAEEIVGRCDGSGPYADGPAWDPVLLVKTASTNDVARDQARKGAKTGFLVAASKQTSGRGRLGRSWESPAGRGLYASLVLRPEMAMEDAGQLTILTSLAVSDAVEVIAGIRPQIKWPNDIVLKGRKLAGVLIETEQKAGRLVFAVIGIGLNVRHEAEDFSPTCATSRLRFSWSQAAPIAVPTFSSRCSTPSKNAWANPSASPAKPGPRAASPLASASPSPPRAAANSARPSASTNPAPFSSATIPAKSKPSPPATCRRCRPSPRRRALTEQRSCAGELSPPVNGNEG